MNTKGKLVFDWNEIDGAAVVHTDCLGLENSLSQQADKPPL
jgi:predicted regulator of Ras-like GTPase activity (Roadblock/LC7/MglB family)